MASEHSKRPMMLSMIRVVRARAGSGRPLRERKPISYIFLLRGILRLRIVPLISRNLCKKLLAQDAKAGLHQLRRPDAPGTPAQHPDGGTWNTMTHRVKIDVEYQEMLDMTSIRDKMPYLVTLRRSPTYLIAAPTRQLKLSGATSLSSRLKSPGIFLFQPRGT